MKTDFTSDDLNVGSALHTITVAREEAHRRGYAEGLEAAANTCEGQRCVILAKTLRDEAKRVREMGVSNDVSK